MGNPPAHGRLMKGGGGGEGVDRTRRKHERESVKEGDMEEQRDTKLCKIRVSMTSNTEVKSEGRKGKQSKGLMGLNSS